MPPEEALKVALPGNAAARPPPKLALIKSDAEVSKNLEELRRSAKLAMTFASLVSIYTTCRPRYIAGITRQTHRREEPLSIQRRVEYTAGSHRADIKASAGSCRFTVPSSPFPSISVSLLSSPPSCRMLFRTLTPYSKSLAGIACRSTKSPKRTSEGSFDGVSSDCEVRGRYGFSTDNIVTKRHLCAPGILIEEVSGNIHPKRYLILSGILYYVSREFF